MTPPSPPPTKPVPSTLSYYRFSELEAYIFATHPEALWIVRGPRGRGTCAYFNVDVKALEDEVGRFRASYHEGAAESVAWFRSEFGDLITVARL